MSLNEVHISSLVVHALPEHLATVKAQIEQFENAEIYGDSPEGKIVVVLETQNQGLSPTRLMPSTTYQTS